MRLFIAFTLDEQVRETAWQAETWLKAHAERGSFPPKENLHLTAAFLGECSEAQTSDAVRLVSTFAFQPVSLHIDRFHTFGHGTWVLLGKAQDGESVVRRLRDGLSALSLPFDTKPFRPHLTIGRRVTFDGEPPRIDIATTLSRLVLFASSFEGGRRLYRPIAGCEARS